MDRHIQVCLNRLSCATSTIATLILLFLFLQTPQTCIPSNSPPKPHLKFPKSTCDSISRHHLPLEKKNKRLWATKQWQKKVENFSHFFNSIRNLIQNHTKVICISAGAGHEVMALEEMGVEDMTGVELVDSPPLVKRADPYNLPFFDEVFDLAFSAHFDEALFPGLFVKEMERVVKKGGACVLLIEEYSMEELGKIGHLFKRSRLDEVKKLKFGGSEMMQIVMRVESPL